MAHSDDGSVVRRGELLWLAATCPELRSASLTLDGQRKGQANWVSADLPLAMKQWPHLENLALGAVDLRNEDAAAMAEALRGLPDLSTLHLAGRVWYEAPGLRDLLAALPAKLVHLRLHGCVELADADVESLLRELPRLELLELEGSNELQLIRYPQASSVAEVRMAKCARLDRIDFHEGAPKALRRLSLEWCAKLPGLDVTQLTNLRSLAIQRCPGRHATHAGFVLPFCALVTLDLRDTAVHLLNLMACPLLESVELGGCVQLCELRLCGSLALAALDLSMLPELRVIHLLDNPMLESVNCHGIDMEAVNLSTHGSPLVDIQQSTFSHISLEPALNP